MKTTLVGYHYTGNCGYNEIKTGFSFDKKGLLPIWRFVTRTVVTGLPEEVYRSASFSLLDPEPKEWTHNQEFPDIWQHLMKHVDYVSPDIVILSFPVLKKDDAFVAERAHIERYKRIRQSQERFMNEDSDLEAHLKYFQSLVPADSYQGGYSLPELVLFSRIPLYRLTFDSRKSRKEVLEKFPS